MPTKRSGDSNTLTLRKAFNEIIFDQFGRTDITLVSPSRSIDSDGRLRSISYSSSTIAGDLQFVTYQDKEILSQGIGNVGDGIFYTIYSTVLDGVDSGGYFFIIVDDVTWELHQMVEAETMDGNRIYQAWVCKRRNSDAIPTTEARNLVSLSGDNLIGFSGDNLVSLQ